MNNCSEADLTQLYWKNRWKYEPMPWVMAVVISTVDIILAFLGTLTNGLVMLIMMRMKRLQNIQNMDIVILSLCFSDFLSSTAFQPQVIFQILARSRFPAYRSQLSQGSGHFVMISGTLSLLLLTFSRYLSIKFPFFFETNATKKWTYVCLAMVYAAAFANASWIFIDGQSESRAFPVIVSVIFFLTIIFQFMIFAVVRAKSRERYRQFKAVQHNQRNLSMKTRRADVQRCKANRTILYICVVYIATWLPSIIFRVYYTIDGDFTFYLKWLHLFTVIIQLHSCINPFVYVLRTSRVKQIFVRIFNGQ